MSLDRHFESVSSRYEGRKRRNVLWITGVGSFRPTRAIKELEKRGYKVTVLRYYDQISDLSNYDIMIGHSAGGTRAELLSHSFKGKVISSGSPTNVGSDQVMYFDNPDDPIVYLLDPSKRGIGTDLGSHGTNNYLPSILEEVDRYDV